MPSFRQLLEKKTWYQLTFKVMVGNEESDLQVVDVVADNMEEACRELRDSSKAVINIKGVYRQGTGWDFREAIRRAAAEVKSEGSGLYDD